MKEIITKRMIPKYIEIQSDQFETVTKYQTEDGLTFEEIDKAVVHESELKMKKVEKTTFWFPMINDIWYKAKDEDELRFLINHLSTNYGGKRYGVDKLKVGEWFTIVSKDRDNYGGTADHFVPLSKLKQAYKELLEILESEKQ